MKTEIPKPPYDLELYVERLRALCIHKNTEGVRAAGGFTQCALTGLDIHPADMCVQLRWREHLLSISFLGMKMAQIHGYWQSPEHWRLEDLLEQSRPMSIDIAKHWMTKPSKWIDHPEEGCFRWKPVEQITLFTTRYKKNTLLYQPENTTHPWCYNGRNLTPGRAHYCIHKQVWMQCERTEKEFA